MTISALRNAIEPGAIVATFTAGTLINRRRTPRLSKPIDDVEAPESDDDEGDEQKRRGESVYQYGTVTRHSSPPPRKNNHTRLLAHFPFLIEIWYWLLTYWIYQGLRAVSARAIQGNEAVFDTAYHHALQILSLEHHLHIDVELAVQRFILDKAPWLMYNVLARIYYSHIVLGVVFLVYCYTFLPRGQYQSIRRTIALENVIAFVIITAWRCMPPRLLPEEFGFLDVLHSNHGGTTWTQNKFQLTIAAMPSLHFANSLFIGFCLQRYSPHLLLRCIAPLWPMMMGLTIVATANHYILDAVVGSCVLLMARRGNRAMLSLLPVERFIFRLIRLEKPEEDGSRPL
ncbi:hypothetical protein VTN02DRAFT_5917 [Thermoascus thermophilus]